MSTWCVCVGRYHICRGGAPPCMLVHDVDPLHAQALTMTILLLLWTIGVP